MQGGALGKSDRTQSFLAASHSNPRILIDSQNKATKGVCVLEQIRHSGRKPARRSRCQRASRHQNDSRCGERRRSGSSRPRRHKTSPPVVLDQNAHFTAAHRRRQDFPEWYATRRGLHSSLPLLGRPNLAKYKSLTCCYSSRSSKPVKAAGRSFPNTFFIRRSTIPPSRSALSRSTR